MRARLPGRAAMKYTAQEAGPTSAGGRGGDQQLEDGLLEGKLVNRRMLDQVARDKNGLSEMLMAQARVEVPGFSVPPRGYPPGRVGDPSILP